MKKGFTIFVILIIIFLSISICCNKNEPTKTDTEKPDVSITYPIHNSEFLEGTIITIKADASDRYGIKEVQFLINGDLVFTDNAEPYQYEWDTVGKVGTHTIKAKAYDKSNNIGNSEIINIIIKVNTPPVASFSVLPWGGNLSVIFQFDASRSRDKEDSFNQLRFSWDWEDDGIWDIENSTNYSPSHQYSSSNYYTIRLKVTDSANFFDDTTRTVDVSETMTMTDIDGNVYPTVRIGNQWWMAENLKVTRYRDGTQIPNLTDSTQWSNDTTGAYCAYDNNSANVSTYGLLYNWYAVNNSHGLAPEGWHVPSDAEWETLVNNLGGASVAGDALKEAGTAHWASPNSGTNSSGFTALPGGDRLYYGNFYHIGYYAPFWSSTEYSWTTYAWHRSLYYDNSQVGRGGSSKAYGFSIRCVRD